MTMTIVSLWRRRTRRRERRRRRRRTAQRQRPSGAAGQQTSRSTTSRRRCKRPSSSPRGNRPPSARRNESVRPGPARRTTARQALGRKGGGDLVTPRTLAGPGPPRPDVWTSRRAGKAAATSAAAAAAETPSKKKRREVSVVESKTTFADFGGNDSVLCEASGWSHTVSFSKQAKRWCHFARVNCRAGHFRYFLIFSIIKNDFLHFASS